MRDIRSTSMKMNATPSGLLVYFGTKAMLQTGQAPGVALTTLGCIGQV